MVLRGGAAASALSFLQARQVAAAAFQPSLLASSTEMLEEVLYVNRIMGPSRLTASPKHNGFVALVQAELERALIPEGGAVVEDTFANYPRWTARSWSLQAGGKHIPVSSDYPHCTGGFTGAREPVVSATMIAKPGTGGGYPNANGSSVVIIPPTTTATGSVVNLGTFTGAGSVDCLDQPDGPVRDGLADQQGEPHRLG